MLALVACIGGTGRTLDDLNPSRTSNREPGHRSMMNKGTAYWAGRYPPVLAPRCEELECDVVRVSKGQCRVPGRVHDATAGDAEFA